MKAFLVLHSRAQDAPLRREIRQLTCQADTLLDCRIRLCKRTREETVVSAFTLQLQCFPIRQAILIDKTVAYGGGSLRLHPRGLYSLALSSHFVYL